MILWFFLGPRAVANVHNFRFLRAFESALHRVSPSIPVGNYTTLKDPRIIEFRSGVGDHLEVFRIFGINVEDPSFRRLSGNLVLSSSQVAVSSCFCFFVGLGHSTGLLVLSVGLLLFNSSHIWIPLGASSSKFGNVLFSSILLRARLLSHHSSNRSACARRALSMLVLVCLITSTYFDGMGRLFHPGCSTLFDVLEKSLPFSCSRMVSSSSFSSCAGFLLAGTRRVGGDEGRIVREISQHLETTAFLLVRLLGA